MILTTTMLVVSSVLYSISSDDNVKRLKVGDRISSFESMPAVDGKTYDLAAFQDHAVLVVCFTCNTCPYAIDYEERLKKLAEKYKHNTSVKVIAVNSNAIDDDSLEKMKQRATEQEFPFLYLKDENQSAAKTFDAIYTPEFFVLNHERRLVYKGALDDHSKADKATVNYVDLAIQAALLKRQPETTAVGARGCAIRFPRKRRKPAEKQASQNASPHKSH